MSELSLKGVPVPSAGDPLLSAFRAAFDGAGVITTVGSVAAAREKLTAALEAGVGPSAQSPWFFRIVGTYWEADGSKNSAGQWVLRPFNEVERAEATFNETRTVTLSANQIVPMMSVALPVRPYPRVVLLDGLAFGINHSGITDFRISGNGGKYKNIGMDVSGEGSVSAQLLVHVPAGEVPVLRWDVRGSERGGKCTYGSTALSYLSAVAFPVAA